MRRFDVRIGGTMKARMGIAMLVTLTLCGTVPTSAQEPTPGSRTNPGVVAEDNMTPYRNLAAETLKAFQAHDVATARKKARELEVAWDTGEKDLKKSSPDAWG